MCAKPVLLIQTGSSPENIREREGDLPDWFRRALGLEADEMEVARVFEGEHLPDPGANQAAIITGSWAMVTDRLDWSEATAEWIRRAMAINMPLFGVCYGHQLMAHALGGEVAYHPAGAEVGCREIERLPAAKPDPLLDDVIPQRFTAHLSHRQTVLTPPANAQVLARSSHDAHQIIRYGANAISTQFHPEFTPAISTACVQRHADVIRKEGGDPDAVLDTLSDTPVARSLLQRFVRTYAV